MARPWPHRTAIQGINSRSRAHFPRQPKDFTSATKNRLRGQKGGSDPALLYCHNIQDSAHSTTPLTTGTKVFISWPGQETSLGVPPETIAVNKRNKTRHKADSRCTRELALRKE